MMCKTQPHTFQWFGTAAIIDTVSGSDAVQVRSEQFGFLGWARCAVATARPLRCGDEVILAGPGLNDLFVVGVMHSANSFENNDGTMQLPNGSYLKSQGDRVSLFSEDNQQLITIEARDGQTAISVPEGDLKFETLRGNIEFASAEDVKIAGRCVNLKARLGMTFSVQDLPGRIRSCLNLSQKSTQIQSPNLDVNTQESNVRSTKLNLSGHQADLKFEQIRTVADKVETTVDRVIENARSVYRSARDLTQIQTGRLRMIVQSVFHMNSKKAFLKTEDDFNVRGESINLG